MEQRECVKLLNVGLDIVLASDHGNITGLTHSALFQQINGGLCRATAKIKNVFSVTGGDAENDDVSSMV